MSTLPTGTVTFLFTDIEGSTKLWEQYPAAMKTALAKHDAILRQAVISNGGSIVKTTGDGIHAVFGTVVTGLAAAFEAQQALQAESWQEITPQLLRVRMGLHTGEAESRDGDYYGSSTNRAARLMAIGHGGQILISSTTAELLREGLPANAALRDLGEHHLKDLSRPEHVYQLVHPSLPAEFPPVKFLDSFPNNLPVQLTSFIGREHEIAEIISLLAGARLVTLMGSGGTGKTRLAEEVSAQILPTFPDGAWFIELAPLAEPSLVISALAQVFGLKELPFTPLETLVRDYLREKNALLILDNCEHLIEACASLADNLLHHCALLKIIVSSREALGIPGEVAYRIPSLSPQEAVQLFVERACAANPKFNLTEANTPYVTQISSRLDGIPLAIELAAARVRLLSPEQIAVRLSDRFRLLIGGSRTALPRQQTLRALIDWSYDLLSAEEKRLLRVASVFVGGWTLDALEEVAEDSDTVEHLDQLVNKSLVVTEECENEMRYALLETIRQYAREKLLDSGVDEAVRIRGRHLGFFVKFTEAAEPRLRGPEMVECMDELEAEQDNLRAAVEWALENDPLSALRMAGILQLFWGRRLPASEGMTWVKAALVRSETRENSDPLYWPARAKALLGQASLAMLIGDNLSGRPAIEGAIEIARRINATWTLTNALGIGASIMAFLGERDLARNWSEEANALSQKYGYAFEQAMFRGEGILLATLSNQPIPPGLPEEMLRFARASGNPWAMAMCFMNAGRAAVYMDNFAQAYSYYEDARALFSKMRDRSLLTSNRSEFGHALRKEGRYSEAQVVYRETIRSFQEIGFQAAVTHELECFAIIAEAQGQGVRAAQLFGAAESMRERLNSDMTPMEHREYLDAVSSLHDEMDEGAVAKAWAEGRAMTMEQAVQYALNG